MTTKLPDKHVYVSEDTLRKHMMDQLSKTERGENRHRKKPTIHKVPDSLRQFSPDAYEPKLVSIGPLHHHKSELQQMDHLKWKYLQDLMERSPVKIRSEDCYDALLMDEFIKTMWKHEQDVRKQYSVDISLGAGELVEVLVLDGCFLIELFIKPAVGLMGSPWNDAMWNLSMLRNDLLLLENQIPFSVLIDLFKIAFPAGFPRPETVGERNPPPLGILDFVLHYISRGRTDVRDLDEQPDEIHHLLHLNHICQLHYFNTAPMQNLSSGTLFSVSKKYTWDLLPNCFFLFVSLILMCKFLRHHSSKRAEFPRVIPSAKNLKEAGIKFNKKFDKGKGCCLNISFDEENGKLDIPSIYLDQNTISLFRNLIALEQSLPEDVGTHFTAYASFMDDIIDTAEDVEILVKHGILEHKLGTNKDVANLFNNLCKGTIPPHYSSYLYGLDERLSKYCALDRHRWRATLVNNYFHNPWAGASVIAAITLLLLTFGATIATIWQTIYTVKSYDMQFHQSPPSS